MGTDLAPIFAIAGLVGLFSAAGLLIGQNFSEARRLRRERAEEIKDLKADVASLNAENERHRAENYACRLQVNSLVTLLQQAGLPLPDWLLRENGGGHVEPGHA